MNPILVIYLISLLANLNIFLSVFFIFGCCFGVAAAIGLSDVVNIQKASVVGYKITNCIKYYLWGMFVVSVLLISMPTERTMYLMYGAKLLKNSDIPQTVFTIIEHNLDKPIKGNSD